MAAILATWRLCAFSLFSICRPCRRFLPSPSIWATTTSNDLHQKKKKGSTYKTVFLHVKTTCSARFVVIIKYTRMSFLNPTGSAYEPSSHTRLLLLASKKKNRRYFNTIFIHYTGGLDSSGIPRVPIATRKPRCCFDLFFFLNQSLVLFLLRNPIHTSLVCGVGFFFVVVNTMPRSISVFPSTRRKDVDTWHKNKVCVLRCFLCVRDLH